VIPLGADNSTVVPGPWRAVDLSAAGAVVLYDPAIVDGVTVYARLLVEDVVGLRSLLDSDGVALDTSRPSGAAITVSTGNVLAAADCRSL
jgi:hypothetical protein